MSVKPYKVSCSPLRPVLKWAGGKTQLLGEIIPRIPLKYGRYVEPFFGGGALFFALKPEGAIISDSNPELINLYNAVASDVENVIEYLSGYSNTEEVFYKLRSLDWTTLPQSAAAARTIFLNRTCFNGLYRVNRKGQFNVPFGRYKNPRFMLKCFCDGNIKNSQFFDNCPHRPRQVHPRGQAVGRDKDH